MLKKLLPTFALTMLPVVLLFSQKRYQTTYEQLKDFEGRYEADGGSTLNIAASPWDTLLYAIIGKAKYPLHPAAKDLFLNNGNQQVAFLRNASSNVIAYSVNKDTFHLLNRDKHYPLTT